MSYTTPENLVIEDQDLQRDYPEETNWSELRHDALDELEVTIRDIVSQVQALKQENATLQASLGQARKRESRLQEENLAMRRDLQHALQVVESVMDTMAVEG